MDKLNSMSCTLSFILLLVLLPLWTTGESPLANTLPQQAVVDEEIRPFKVELGEDLLQDLKARLRQVRWPDQLQEMADPWAYGTELSYMQQIVHYWINDFDWPKQEALLNQMPQFTTVIDGLRIHFVHARSSAAGALPLLFVHGWPGSFFECYKILPLLTAENASLPFHVVCPSIPGYGFSEAPKTPGYDSKKFGGIFGKLMLRLGYKEFYTQGGDWGSVITVATALTFPGNVKGAHLNFFAPRIPLYGKGIWASIKSLFTILFPRIFLSESDADKLVETPRHFLRESGYLHIQATRPQTIGYALNDSPVGLAAYIIEKFRYWSDCNGDVETRFSKDELLTNVMIYWGAACITSSMRLYYEEFHGPRNPLMVDFYLSTPTGAAIFPKEIASSPRHWLEYYYNITTYTVMPRGGHFAALEEPHLLVEDLRRFVQQVQTPAFSSTKDGTEL
jgi:pimeloyl-ACP methyl ester carboxylesterase